MPKGGHASPWLRSQPECGQQARLRIVCFPPAGGGATSFEPLFHAAGPKVECLTVELPGHTTRLREPPARNPYDLFAQVTAAIAETVAGEGLPYVLLGQCMGAIVAYEVAARLEERQARPPIHLVVAGSNPPQDEPIAVEDPVAFLRATGNPDELFEMPELLDMTIGILHEDLTLLRAYRCANRVLRTPITVLYGDRDPYVDRPGQQGWKALSSEEVSVEELPGGHNVLDQHYESLLRRLQENPASGLGREA